MANIRGAGGKTRKYDVYVSFSKEAFETAKNIPVEAHMNHQGITKAGIKELVDRPGSIADKDNRLSVKKFQGKDGKEHVGSSVLYAKSQVEAMLNMGQQPDAKGKIHTFEDEGRVYAAFKAQLIPRDGVLVINTQSLEPAAKPFDSVKCLEQAKEGSAKLREALNAKYPPKEKIAEAEPAVENEVQTETDGPAVGE